MSSDDLWQEQIEEQAMFDLMEAEREYEQSLLETRGSTHGDFKDNSDLVQGLKLLVLSRPEWYDLENYQKEAIDMIFHKIGRIMLGDHKFIDSWRDIAGYAELVTKQLEQDPEASDVRNVKMFNLNGIWHDESSSI